MKVAYFAHSVRSCWNNGNAHFQRGILAELARRGHAATAWEPADGWSRENLLRDHGAAALDGFAADFPEFQVSRYADPHDVERAVDGADLVIAHEWNGPEIFAALGRARRHARFTLLFHDTHHRAVSDPAALRQFDLREFDGVLAFGATLAEVYRRDGWGHRAFVWHEAADTTRFRPPAIEVEREGLVWIGNWGDGERSAELEAFLLRPAQDAGLALDVHGVRYPAEASRLLEQYGARFRGWLPNAAAPAVFARHLATVHVPRRFYVDRLPGIPTIRVFEALACGIPLVSAPWHDTEGLFVAGRDYLVAHDTQAARRHFRTLRHDAALRASLARAGLHAVTSRHTCAHRVDELLGIVARLHGIAAPPEIAA